MACCTNVGLNKGSWTAEEDELLANYIKREGEGKCRTLPKEAGLLRCGKSCCLRWMNYLHPSVKRGHITPDEEDLIFRLHRLLGNRWSLIAGKIPGRTDNEIKNYWNTHLSKKLISQGIDPKTHRPFNPNPSIDDNKLDSSSQSAVHTPLSNLHYVPLSLKNVMIENVVHQNAEEDGPKKDLGKSYDGVSHEDGDVDAGKMIDCYPDEAFSSLDSLINDDMLSNQHQD